MDLQVLFCYIGDTKYLYRQGADLPVRPYRIGNEFSMTKGDRHADPNKDEWYFCLSGKGLLQIEEDQTRWIQLEPGTKAYIHGNWGHRLINTGINLWW